MPATIVVDTNEDGFTRANIEAICATGKSSKKATSSDNHIGEKGFGFKSVFSVAEEVHVQSGLWSFRFKHKHGEDGLGMVTPLEACSKELPSGVATRITLILSDSTDGGHQRLLDAIAQIPDTTILHLHNLRNIMVTKASINPLSTSFIIGDTSMFDHWGRTVSIQTLKTTTDGGYECIDKAKFYKFTHRLNFMPQDDRRLNRTSATVELAFPIHLETNEPKLTTSGQHMFAYLPLYRLPIQFIVQSDFITSANRESVIDCAWNEALRDGVVESFCNAVATFATNNHPLRHLWLKYLPREAMHNSFWEPLSRLIKSRLKDMPVLQSWQGRVFKSPTELRWLPNKFIHEGSPIFNDLSNEIYLAPEYGGGLTAALDVQVISWLEALSRAEADLVSLESRIKTRAPYDAWHEACAKIIIEGLHSSHSNRDEFRRRIRNMAMVPINNGRSWTGAPGVNPGGVDNIYFPTTDDIEIPGKIGLHLVDQAAASIPWRRRLFQWLGVKECPKSEVLSKIEALNRSGTWKGQIVEIITELRYLFRFHPEPKLLESWVLIPVGSAILIHHGTSGPVYFRSEKEYDAQKLLPSLFAEDDRPNDVANFFRQELIEAEYPHTYSQGFLWSEWLRNVTGARYYPPLQTRGLAKPEISKTMLAVLEHAQKFLGMLKAHWNEYKTEVHLVNKQLGGLKLPCIAGGCDELRKCYLPTSEIVAQLRSLEAEGCVPLLQLPVAWDEGTRLEWDFLSELGVRSRIDLDFYLTINSQFMARKEEDWTLLSKYSKDTMAELYVAMAGIATASDYDRLRRDFTNGIATFDSKSKTPKYRRSFCCLWDGPQFMIEKAPLKQYYHHIPLLETFFKVFLEIRDYCFDDIITEMEMLDGHAKTKKEWEEIYRFLNDNLQHDAEWREIRKCFEKYWLIHIPDGKMHILSNCVWMSPFSLSDYVELAHIYPDLEQFFVKHLQVEKANPSMLINEIMNMTKNLSLIDDIRKRLIDIGRILTKSGIDATVSRALARLKKVKFLPKEMEDGRKTLVGVDDDFVINDHQRFSAAFRSQNVLLDFDNEEVLELNKILEHMGLVDRYLSQAVDEASAVGNDAIESAALTMAFRCKAYVLYCCAAHYKSTKALRDDFILFNRLSSAQIYMTESITTDLVLKFKSEVVKVQSDRLAVHHKLSNDQLKFYVPKDERQRKSCYRSQLPRLLADLMGVASNATQAIFQILSHEPWELNDILLEQDISLVSWIEKPTYNVPSCSVNNPDNVHALPRTPPEHSPENPARETPTSSSSSRTARSASGPTAAVNEETHISFTTPTTSTARPPLYESFVEAVVQSAYRARNRQEHSSSTAGRPCRSPPISNLSTLVYDHEETFGCRDADEMAHDRRIGASGEGYVFEILSALNLPDFSLENWRSTIRRELCTHPRYTAVTNWKGRETADFVYRDLDGSLTQYLRKNCFGGMPDAIALDRDFAHQPLEYFLEVKATTSRCDTRFFMSGRQYKMMKEYAVPTSGDFTKAYVILRVFELGQNTDLRIFVDPYRFQNLHIIDFQVGTYHCKTNTAVQKEDHMADAYSGSFVVLVQP